MNGHRWGELATLDFAWVFSRLETRSFLSLGQKRAGLSIFLRYFEFRDVAVAARDWKQLLARGPAAASGASDSAVQGGLSCAGSQWAPVALPSLFALRSRALRTLLLDALDLLLDEVTQCRLVKLGRFLRGYRYIGEGVKFALFLRKAVHHPLVY